MRFHGTPSEPKPAPSLDDFVSGRSAANRKPWGGMDPDATRRTGVNLRLNDWELEVLRHVAKREGRSQLDVIRRALRPVLDEYVVSQDEQQAAE